MERTEKGTPKGDLSLVARIERGDAAAWESFVNDYTAWALYRAQRWCREHCPHRRAGASCALITVARQMEGTGVPRPDGDECGDGLDSYIWILEQLRKKIRRYTGKNNSRLSTYIWTVLNSRELYVDWLRWKYGRVF